MQFQRKKFWLSRKSIFIEQYHPYHPFKKHYSYFHWCHHCYVFQQHNLEQLFRSVSSQVELRAIYFLQNGCFHCIQDTEPLVRDLFTMLWLILHLLKTSLVSAICLPLYFLFMLWYAFLIRCTPVPSPLANTFIWEAVFTSPANIRCSLQCQVLFSPCFDLVITYITSNSSIC